MIVRGTVQKPTRDSLGNDAAYVGCSFGRRSRLTSRCGVASSLEALSQGVRF
jgi:hypothetical protein